MRAEKLGLLRVVTVGMVGSLSSSSSELELSSLEDSDSLVEVMLVSPSFSVFFVTVPFGLPLRRGMGALVSVVAVAVAVGSSLRAMVAQNFWYVDRREG